MQRPSFFPISPKVWITAFLPLAIGACSPGTDAPPTESTKPITAELDTSISVEKASEELFAFGDQVLERSKVSATELAQSIAAFLQNPTDETLLQAQQQWRKALLDYRKFGGLALISIADASTFATLNRLDYQISAFPIQPGFLDKFGEHKYSGIVHDIGMEISEESLTAQHGLTDLSEAVLGLYTIDFMLFDRGQARELDDFTKITQLSKSLRERGFESINEIPNNRRRELLQQQAQVLVSNLNALQASWSGQQAQTRSAWDALPGKAALAREALRAAVTKVMLEVSELNSDISDEEEEYSDEISPSVKAADFAFQQDFIANALASLVPLTKFYGEQQAQSLQETLSALKVLSEARELAKDQTEKDHWREMFSLIKRSSDIASAEASPKKAP